MGKERKILRSYLRWRHKEHWPEQSRHPSPWRTETLWLFCPFQDSGEPDVLRPEGVWWRPPLWGWRQRSETFLRALAAPMDRLEEKWWLAALVSWDHHTTSICRGAQEGKQVAVAGSGGEAGKTIAEERGVERVWEVTDFRISSDEGRLGERETGDNHCPLPLPASHWLFLIPPLQP